MPVQSPRIPVWAGGLWPIKAPIRRAVRWDGAFPASSQDGGMAKLSVDEVCEIAVYIAAHRTTDGEFDLIFGGEMPGDVLSQAGESVASYAEAGVTRW